MTREEGRTSNIGYTKSGQCLADSLVLNLQVHRSVGSSVEARLLVAAKRYQNPIGGTATLKWSCKKHARKTFIITLFY